MGKIQKLDWLRLVTRIFLIHNGGFIFWNFFEHLLSNSWRNFFWTLTILFLDTFCFLSLSSFIVRTLEMWNRIDFVYVGQKQSSFFQWNVRFREWRVNKNKLCHLFPMTFFIPSFLCSRFPFRRTWQSIIYLHQQPINFYALTEEVKVNLCLPPFHLSQVSKTEP